MAKEKKLTAVQQAVLNRMRSGALAHYMPYMGRFRPNPYWFLDDNMEHCTRQVQRLIKLGLARYSKREYSGSTAVAVMTGETK